MFDSLHFFHVGVCSSAGCCGFLISQQDESDFILSSIITSPPFVYTCLMTESRWGATLLHKDPCVNVFISSCLPYAGFFFSVYIWILQEMD